MMPKEIRQVFLRHFVFFFCCVCGYLFPLELAAQEADDSVSVSIGEPEVESQNSSLDNKPEKIPEITVLRSVPDTTVSRLKKEKAFAYANDPAYWTKQKPQHKKGFWDYVFDFFSSSIVRWIFYILLAALAIFVLYRIIVVNDLLVFYSSRKTKTILNEQDSREIDGSLIDEKIRQAIDGKQYNIAVRYLYLKTLYALTEKNAINYHVEGTNNEYLNQMAEHKLGKEFRFLTLVYEYVWYGKFDITEEQFSLVHNNFKNLHSAIR